MALKDLPKRSTLPAQYCSSSSTKLEDFICCGLILSTKNEGAKTNPAANFENFHRGFFAAKRTVAFYVEVDVEFGLKRIEEGKQNKKLQLGLLFENQETLT